MVHWSKGPKATEIKAGLKANHWSKGPKAKAIGERLGNGQRGKKRSSETIAKIALKNTGKRHSEESKQRMRRPKSAEHIANMKTNHALNGPKRDVVIANIKASRTPELRLKVAKDVQAGICGFRTSQWTVFVDRKGRSFNMRSSWEAKTAYWLDTRGYDWEYEPEPLLLSDGSVYLPDFLLKDGRYIEVKGYLSPKSAQKISICRKDGRRILLFNKSVLIRLGVI